MATQLANICPSCRKEMSRLTNAPNGRCECYYKEEEMKGKIVNGSNNLITDYKTTFKPKLTDLHKLADNLNQFISLEYDPSNFDCYHIRSIMVKLNQYPHSLETSYSTGWVETLDQAVNDQYTYLKSIEPMFKGLLK